MFTNLLCCTSKDSKTFPLKNFTLVTVSFNRNTPCLANSKNDNLAILMLVKKKKMTLSRTQRYSAELENTQNRECPQAPVEQARNPPDVEQHNNLVCNFFSFFFLCVLIVVIGCKFRGKLSFSTPQRWNDFAAFPNKLRVTSAAAVNSM